MPAAMARGPMARGQVSQQWRGSNGAGTGPAMARGQVSYLMRVNGAAGFFVDHGGWSGDQVRINCDFMVLESLEGLKNKGNFVEGEIQAELLWDPVSGEVTKVSMKVE